MNKKIMGVLLATTMLLGIFTGCKKNDEIKPSCPVDHLTVQYSGACLYNEEQYSIYSIIAPYEYEIIYENTENEATASYIGGPTPTPVPNTIGYSYIAIKDDTIKLKINGFEQTVNVKKYANDDVFEPAITETAETT